MATTTRILLLSRYASRGASSRVRSYQYLPFLDAAGFRVTVEPFFDDRYVERRFTGVPASRVRVARAFAQRISAMRARHDHDILWVESEALPWLPFAFERSLFAGGVPVVVDYDDAIFHRYDQHGNAAVRALLGGKIDRIMRAATVVVCGNDYLAERARRAGAPRVEILPSVIDLARYRQRADDARPGFVIGWIGSASTTPHLRMLEPVLPAVKDVPGVSFVNVGGLPLTIDGVPTRNVAWSEAGEVAAIQEFDVGVMPLPDDPWARGKCGFKLIQCMGCALPVVASAVGANLRIVDHGVTGYLAATQAEWVDALRRLAQDPGLRSRMGCAAYAKCERQYALAVTAPRLVAIFDSLRRPAAGA